MFKDLVIDHVIAETTAKDTERLVDLRVTHALGVDFDVLGDENLAPACHACNTAKAALLLSPEHAALYLTQVKGRLPKFNSLKARYEKETRVDKAGLGLSLALEKGLISPAEVGNSLRRYQAGWVGTGHLPFASQTRARRVPLSDFLPARSEVPDSFCSD